MTLSASFGVVITSDLEVELRGQGDGPKEAELVANLIAQCTEEMETILRRKIVTRGPITEFHTFRTCESELFLDQFPIISAPTIYEDTGRDYGATSLLVEGADYLVDYELGKVTRISGDAETAWSTGLEAVKVIYAGGYAQTDVPGDIKRIALEWIAMKFNEVIGHSQGRASVSDGLGTRTFIGPADFTSHMIKRLQRHKKYSFGRDTFSRSSVA